jgi:hypothetical protein
VVGVPRWAVSVLYYLAFLGSLFIFPKRLGEVRGEVIEKDDREV